MRWVYIGITVVLALAVLVFALQNLDSVTLAFLGWSLTAPVAIVAVAAYLLGMATGSSLFALVRHMLAQTRPPHQGPST